MAKQIVCGDSARQAVLRGINQLADAVKVTLGPRGRHVIIGKHFGSSTITKDGVTVAKEIDLRDPLDPTKVVRTALQNSASIFSLLLTTETLVSETPEGKKQAASPGPAGMGGMGGMH